MPFAEIAFDVPLMPEEQALENSLEFDSSELIRREYDERIQNGDGVLQLFRLLVARNAIPEHRRKFFTEPEWYPGGRHRSLKQIFEDNGTRGDDIARHAHFLSVMRYFIHGPDLSPVIKAAFAKAVHDAGGEISGSEVIEVSRAARTITRNYELAPHSAAGEIYKLALEHGAHSSWAKMIYESVRSAKVR